MKTFILIILLPFIFIGCNKSDKNKFVVGYYYSNNKNSFSFNKIEFNNLTHICHAFAWPDSNGKLIMDSNFVYPELINAAHENGKKILVSVGGWKNDKWFSKVASNKKIRKNFIENLTQFCKNNNYDGADIDWEYPKNYDKNNFTLLASELRKAFNNNNIELLTTVLPAKNYNKSFNINVIKNHFDWFGIMTYDYHGFWSPHSGHISPLYSSQKDTCGSVDESVKYYLSKGIPKEKLLIGMPFYSRSFNTSKLYENILDKDSINSYKTNSKLFKSWVFHWDSLSFVPYLTNPNQTKILSFEDTTSISLKCKYILKDSLKGTIIWALGNDFNGKSQPLLEIIGKYLIKK